MTIEQRESFWQRVQEDNLRALFRPRDKFDVDVDPETVRGRWLALEDEMSSIRAALPFWARWWKQ